jgi:phosphoenolpyruvate carboxylase
MMGFEEGKVVQAKSIGNIFNKVIAENFQNFKKEIPTQAQEASRAPNRYNQNRTSPLHIMVKTLSTENKERILKAEREKYQVINKGKPIRTTPNFSTETLKERRTCSEIFQVLKENNFKPGYSTQQRYYS